MGPKRNDLEPALYMDIADPAGVGNLNTVSSWRMIARLRDATATLFIDVAPTVTVDTNTTSKAVVKHTWIVGETATAGVVLVEVEATWPGGRKQTFPSSGYAAIRIIEDLA
jgi:hypothetical protein